MMNAIQTWLSSFEGLAGGIMHVDWLPAEAQTYSVDSVPAEPVLIRYMDGSSRRQKLFLVASREYFAPDVDDQIQNTEWFDTLSDWVETQNLQRNFPDLGKGRKCKSIELITTAYPVDVSDDGMARYQVQMRMIYLQEA